MQKLTGQVVDSQWLYLVLAWIIEACSAQDWNPQLSHLQSAPNQFYGQKYKLQIKDQQQIQLVWIGMIEQLWWVGGEVNSAGWVI